MMYVAKDQLPYGGVQGVGDWFSIEFRFARCLSGGSLSWLNRNSNQDRDVCFKKNVNQSMWQSTISNQTRRRFFEMELLDNDVVII